MWHICGSHAGPGVQGTVPLMKGQGTWLRCPLLPLTLGFLEQAQWPQNYRVSISKHPFLSFPSVLSSQTCPGQRWWWIFLHTHS